VTSRNSASRFSAVPPWTRLWLADSALLLVSQLLTTVATSVAAVLIARQLEPRDWGVFSGFLALSVALAVVVEFGTTTWLLRELSRLFAAGESVASAASARLVNAGLILSCSLAGLMMLGGLATARLRHLAFGTTIALGSLLAYSGLITAAILIEAHLRASRRVARVAAATVLEKYLLVMLVLGVALLHGGVAGLGLAYVAAGITRVAFVWLSVFHRVGRGGRAPDAALIKHVFRRSIPFALTSSCLSVVPKLDAFLLLTLSATSAGYFALGDRLLGPAVVFPEVLSVTLYPFFARRSQHLSTPWLLSSVFAGVGGAIAVGVIFAAPTFVPLVFGAKYMGALPAIQVMVLALPFLFALGPFRVHAYSRDQEKKVVAMAFGVSLLGGIGIVTGQWMFGIVAAASAYVIRYILFVVGMALISARSGGAEVRAAVVPPAISTSEATPL
jgi:O-antigen/teichoic acid export membrane protein